MRKRHFFIVLVFLLMASISYAKPWEYYIYKQLKGIAITSGTITNIEEIDQIDLLRNIWVTSGTITNIEELDQIDLLRNIWITSGTITNIEQLDQLDLLRNIWITSGTITNIEQLDQLDQLRNIWITSGTITLTNTCDTKAVTITSGTITEVQNIDNCDTKAVAITSGSVTLTNICDTKAVSITSGTITDITNTVTVDTTDFDIRDLTDVSDSVDVTHSTPTFNYELKDSTYVCRDFGSDGSLTVNFHVKAIAAYSQGGRTDLQINSGDIIPIWDGIPWRDPLIDESFTNPVILTIDLDLASGTTFSIYVRGVE